MARITIQELKEMQKAYKFYTPNSLEQIKQKIKTTRFITIDTLMKYFTECYIDTFMKNKTTINDLPYWDKYCKDNSDPDLLPSTVKSREIDRLRDITDNTKTNCFLVIHYLEDLIVSQVINKKINPFLEVEFYNTIENIRKCKSVIEFDIVSVMHFDNMEKQFVNTYLEYCKINYPI